MSLGGPRNTRPPCGRRTHAHLNIIRLRVRVDMLLFENVTATFKRCPYFFWSAKIVNYCFALHLQYCVFHCLQQIFKVYFLSIKRLFTSYKKEKCPCDRYVLTKGRHDKAVSMVNSKI